MQLIIFIIASNISLLLVTLLPGVMTSIIFVITFLVYYHKVMTRTRISGIEEGKDGRGRGKREERERGMGEIGPPSS